MAASVLIPRFPSSFVLFSPVPTQFENIAQQDVGTLAPGTDGMDSDFVIAMTAAAAEQPSIDDLGSIVDSLEADSALQILGQVDATGAAIQSFQAAGDVLIADVSGLTPPGDPSQSAPPTPAPPAGGGIGAGGQGGPGGGGGGDDNFCSTCTGEPVPCDSPIACSLL